MKTEKVKSGCAIFILLLIAIFVVSTCYDINNKSNDKSGSNASEENASEENEAEVVQVSDTLRAWEYNSSYDEMNNSLTLYAVNNSLNLANFEFPYDGGSKLQIIISKNNETKEAILHITKGQFLSSYNEIIQAKFDDGNIIDYSFSESSLGKSDYIFLNNSNDFIERINKAYKILIKVGFYQEGYVNFSFINDGIDWTRVQ